MHQPHELAEPDGLGEDDELDDELEDDELVELDEVAADVGELPVWGAVADGPGLPEAVLELQPARTISAAAATVTAPAAPPVLRPAPGPALRLNREPRGERDNMELRSQQTETGSIMVSTRPVEDRCRRVSSCSAAPQLGPKLGRA